MGLQLACIKTDTFSDRPFLFTYGIHIHYAQDVIGHDPDPDIFSDRHIIERAWNLIGAGNTDFYAFMGWICGDLLAFKIYLAFILFVFTHNQIKGCGFARTVWADQTQRLSLVNVEA